MAADKSLEAWIETLLEGRHCMDCKTEIEGLEGAMVFRGQIPQNDLEGHLCETCWG